MLKIAFCHFDTFKKGKINIIWNPKLYIVIAALIFMIMIRKLEEEKCVTE
jgi:hypothetical protein